MSLKYVYKLLVSINIFCPFMDEFYNIYWLPIKEMSLTLTSLNLY
jgi:hypothetical protein